MRTVGTFEAETLPPHHYRHDPPVPIAWKSTLPIYLFGGLVAMLGLIAIALIILACSYWKLAGFFNSSGDDEKENSDETKEKGGEAVVSSVLVIMAGEDRPTFLGNATSAVTSRVTSEDGGGHNREITPHLIYPRRPV